MNKKGMMRYLAILAMLFVTAIATAGNYTISAKESKPATSTVISVEDKRVADWVRKDVQVTLDYGRQTGSDLLSNGGWDYTVTFDLKVYDRSNAIIYSETGISLTIDFDANGKGDFIDVYRLSGLEAAKRVEVTVTATSGNPGIGSVPGDVQLEASIVGEEYGTSFGPMSSFVGEEITEGSEAVRYELRWDYVPGAEGYEVEWLFIDDYFKIGSSAVNTVLGSLGHTFAFDKTFYTYNNISHINPVNIQTSDQHYAINLTYPAGTLYYRMRPIGVFIDNDGRTHKRYGQWLYSSTDPFYEIEDGFEADKTWTSSTVFAEEGKYKKSLGYFDESQRNTQSLVTLSTEDNILVSKTVFDYEGRPGATVLPSPIHTSSLKYKTGFAIAETGAINGDDLFQTKYLPNSFEGTTTPFPLPLSTDIGASNYYSPDNDGSMSVNGVNMSYLPDAGKYPYVQTTYKNDNTNRVTSQSGLGPDHTLGSTHAVKYYYSTPTATKLHRLFGSNVGKASHYQEIVTKDPNGQYTITYLDQEGRTIATALMGPSPDNLAALDYNTPETVTVSLKGNSTDDETDLEFESTTILPIETEKEVLFSYSMSNLLDDGVNCFNCSYDLTIFIKNGDGDLIELYDISSNSQTYNDNTCSSQGVCDQIHEIIEPDCAASATLLHPSTGAITFAATLNEGEYTIVKKLKVITEFVYDESINDFLEERYGLPDFNIFVADAIANIDYSPCDVITDPSDPAIGLSGSSFNLDQVIEDAGNDNCYNKLMTMRQQVQPGGYYYDQGATSGIWDYITTNNLDDNWTLVDGTAPVTQTHFYDGDLFNPDWVEDYVDDYLENNHPEYCHYLVCIDLAAPSTNSFEFEISLRLIENWADANTAGYLDADDIMDVDPLLTTLYTSLGNFDIDTDVDGMVDAYEIYDHGNDVYQSTGTDLFSFYNPLSNPLSGTVTSISMASPFGTVVNPMYAGVDPLEVDRMHWMFIVNAYINIRNRALEIALDNVGCEYILVSGEAPEHAVFINPVGIGQVNQTDALALAASQCEEDAILLANNWVSILQGYDIGEMNNTAPAKVAAVASLRSSLIEYLRAEFCVPIAPNDAAFFPWPAQVPIDQLVNTCTAIDQDLADLIDVYTTSLGIEPSDLFPQLGSSFISAYLTSETNSLVISGSPGYTSSSTAALYSLKDISTISLATANSMGYQHDVYLYILNRVGSWMDMINKNCPAIKDQSPAALEYIELLLIRYVLDNFHIFNRNIIIDAATIADCKNTQTLGELADLMAYFGCGINSTITINEMVNVNDCPFVLPCGENLFEMINQEVFGYGSSGSAVSLMTFSVEKIDSYFPTCLDDAKEPTGSLSFDTEIASTTYNLAFGSCKLYLMNACGDVFPWYYGMELANATATAGQGSAMRPNGFLHDLLFTGLTAEISYPSGVTNPCQTNLAGLAGQPNPPSKVYLLYYTEGGSCNFNDLIKPCPNYETVVENPCRDALEDEAEDLAIAEWNMMLEDVLTQYLQELRRQCFDNHPEEEFTATYDLNEYHYTLYYYDQSGNLLQTVPPAGVQPLSLNPTAGYFDGNGNYLNGEPAHTLPTQYKYNSLNQLVWQSTPDGGETEFWYNTIGQLRYSRNAKQKDNMGTAHKYSYTKYDGLGRVVEVGETNDGTGLADLDNMGLPGGNRTDITATYYNGTFAHPDFEIINYRNRVTTTARYDSQLIQDNAESTSPHLVATTGSNNINATYYQYDELGNVKALVQQIEGFEQKRMEYGFDLLSGNVNKVSYQPGEQDAFYHAYTYDADNRLTTASTSRDHIIWEEDARYFYYPHGPLARVEIGQDNVQGMDYYYTIHGWLKGINRPYTGEEFNSITPTVAMGDSPDGISVYSNNLNSLVPRDELTSILGYYQGDYTPIGKTVSSTNPMSTAFSGMLQGMWPMIHDTGDDSYDAHPGLYNGNIAMGYMDLSYLWYSEDPYAIPSNKGAKVSAYSYDQLNRLVASTSAFKDMGMCEADAYGGSHGIIFPSPNVDCGYTPPGTTPKPPFRDAYTALGYYNTAYSYDKNGNILSLDRHDGEGDKFDELIYSYQSNTNRLTHVNDEPMLSAVLTGVDIENQSSDNYQYDNIGNLIADAAEGLYIEWDAYGKVQKVYKGTPFTAGLTDPGSTWRGAASTIEFFYDAMGRRVGKKLAVEDKITYYVLDASGNTMATYHRESSSLPYGTEHHIYGSSRLGTYSATYTQQEEVETDEVLLTSQLMRIISNPQILNDVSPAGPSVGDAILYMGGRYEIVGVTPNPFAGRYTIRPSAGQVTTLWAKGRKGYELTDHLGNVNVVIGDERLGNEVDVLIDDMTGDYDFYNGHIIDAPNVYSWELPGTGGYSLLTGETYRVDVEITAVSGSVLFWVEDPATSTWLANTTITATGIHSLSFTVPAGGDIEVYLMVNVGNSFTMGDVLLSRGAPNGAADYYLASIRMAQDYYPGGMPMPGRSYQPGEYRYGHNGQESDPELAGEWGSLYTAEFWMYDSRLIRRWELDPITRTWESPYAAYANNPIYFNDVKGLSPDGPQKASDDEWQTKNSDGTYTGNRAEPFRIDEVVITPTGETPSTPTAGQTTHSGTVDRVRSFDPSAGSNNQTGYRYSANDMLTRQKVLRTGGAFARGLLSRESDGHYGPIYDANSPYGQGFQSNWDAGYFGMGEDAQQLSDFTGGVLSIPLLAAAGGTIIMPLIVETTTLTIATAEGVAINVLVRVITIGGRQAVAGAVTGTTAGRIGYMTAGEIRLMNRLPQLSSAMFGKGVDRGFRMLGSQFSTNPILWTAEKLRLITFNPTNRGADMIGRGILSGRWWDVTTPASWPAHVAKYGSGGTPLLYTKP